MTCEPDSRLVPVNGMVADLARMAGQAPPRMAMPHRLMRTAFGADS